jgi:DNA-binding CsgD family transcriptional regulator
MGGRPIYNHLRLRDLRDAFRLVGECTELGPDAHAWRQRLFDGLRQLTGAAIGVGGETEGMFGIDPQARALLFIYSGMSKHDQQVFLDYMARDDYVAIDPVIKRFARPLRSLMTKSDDEVVPSRVRHRCEFFSEYFRPLGLDDRIMSFCRVTREGSVSRWNGISLERALGDQPFTVRDRQLVHFVHCELKPLMGTRLATFDDRQARPLSPRLRKVLDLLMLGRSEKQIACECKLAQSSVHKYITMVYRRFGVSGRAELMALFLNWRGTKFSPGRRGNS